MDKLEKYRQIIKKVLTEDAKYAPSYGEIEAFLVFDDEHDSYQLMHIGWNQQRRTHGPVIHVRIKNEKIWVEYDGTEEGVTTALLKAGIPKQDIVLAFHPEWKRKLMDFAVA
jgi:hypothetical protein